MEDIDLEEGLIEQSVAVPSYVYPLIHISQFLLLVLCLLFLAFIGLLVKKNLD